ncbi:macrolide ABC transporter ATP-binding protein [Paenibacillus macquariensis subsp. macquariensis]|uniref:ABC transport system ATP-binding protein n=2 Tax=Paenibacillus macquariensis TaxID=948756 RepID=A0ABY1JNF7_9BACL|nr:macrolide ABC transporter ATP-binding protein [Paenibacillus macquariensis subsp. macquariensis]SIQ49867.1 putative ABC transport system ATP-binding protein [Paenibacillus macquariensis]
MITFEDVDKVYASGEMKVHALKGVSLHIHEREFVSIMGPSGSGKSTLMNVIGCLDKPSSGIYTLDGINVGTASSKQLSQVRNQKIGFVFQNFNLLKRTSAIENVELPMLYGGRAKKERLEKAQYCLERVGLKDRMYHKPNELSGGQQQRVAIARALSNDPAIILADEPTGNLDSASSEEIMNIFRTLNDNGNTIVVVTHETDIAAYTQRIICFRDGRIETDRFNMERGVI